MLFLFKIGNTISYQDSSPHILCTVLTVGFLTLEQNAWENQHLQLTGLTALEGSGTFALSLWQGWACWQEHLGAQSHSCHPLGSTKGRVQSFKIAFKHMSAGKPHNESPSSEVLPPPMPYGTGGTVTSQTRAIKMGSLQCLGYCRFIWVLRAMFSSTSVSAEVVEKKQSVPSPRGEISLSVHKGHEMRSPSQYQ